MTELSNPNQRRYPDPSIRGFDPRFDALRLASASVECLYQGARWSEGPVWFGDGRFVLWSDIPNNRILRWDEETGAVTPFRRPSNNANGNTRDREGRLVTCEHLTRRVTRTEYDGSITVIADRYQGKRFNSPNDVVGDGRSLANNRVLINAQQGTPDGFRIDIHGNLWCGWGMGTDELDGVRVFSPQGEVLGHIALPERCANVCFGGRHRNRLFMAASHGLYSLYVNTQGVRGG